MLPSKSNILSELEYCLHTVGYFQMLWPQKCFGVLLDVAEIHGVLWKVSVGWQKWEIESVSVYKLIFLSFLKVQVLLLDVGTFQCSSRPPVHAIFHLMSMNCGPFVNRESIHDLGCRLLKSLKFFNNCCRFAEINNLFNLNCSDQSPLCKKENKTHTPRNVILSMCKVIKTCF